MGLADVHDRVERPAEHLEHAARMLATGNAVRVDLPPFVSALAPGDAQHQLRVPVVVGSNELAPVSWVEVLGRSRVARHGETLHWRRALGNGPSTAEQRGTAATDAVDQARRQRNSHDTAPAAARRQHRSDCRAGGKGPSQSRDRQPTDERDDEEHGTTVA